MAVTKENGYVMTLNDGGHTLRLEIVPGGEGQEPTDIGLQIRGPGGSVLADAVVNPRFVRGFNELWSLIRLDFPDAPTWNG